MSATPNPYLYVLEEPFSRAEVLEELSQTPARLREAVGTANEAALLRRGSADGWSAFQTFCHVRDATLTYASRFRWIVFDDNPLMPDYDEKNWVAASKDTPADVPDILEQVAASRADLVRVLSRLDVEAWLRTGRHEVAGSIILEHYVRHQVVHERMHLEQIRNALNS